MREPYSKLMLDSENISVDLGTIIRASVLRKYWKYEKQPWDERTERMALVARDCPQLEAFLDFCFQDIFDPAQSKKISDNLTKEQRDFIKTLKHKNQIHKSQYRDKKGR